MEDPKTSDLRYKRFKASSCFSEWKWEWRGRPNQKVAEKHAFHYSNDNTLAWARPLLSGDSSLANAFTLSIQSVNPRSPLLWMQVGVNVTIFSLRHNVFALPSFINMMLRWKCIDNQSTYETKYSQHWMQNAPEEFVGQFISRIKTKRERVNRLFIEKIGDELEIIVRRICGWTSSALVTLSSDSLTCVSFAEVWSLYKQCAWSAELDDDVISFQGYWSREREITNVSWRWGESSIIWKITWVDGCIFCR